MDNYGNFGRNYCKEVVVKDEEGKEVCIKLKYTALTPLLYRNYFATDMFDDLAKIASKNLAKEKLIEKLDKDGIESLTEQDVNLLAVDDAVLFFDKFAVVLVATAIHPQTLSYETIRETMLPEDFITDERYIKLFDAIQELYTPVMDDYKKKLKLIQAKAARKQKTLRG